MSRVPAPEKLDWIVAAVFVVFVQVELWAWHDAPGPRPVAELLAIVLIATVAVRRRAPLAAGLTAMVIITIQGLTAGHGTSVAQAIAWMCGLYAIAVWTSPRGFAIGACALVALNALSLLGPPPQSLQMTGLFTIIPLGAMVLLRGAVRGRQLRAEALAARAEMAERGAAQAVLEERARI